MILKCRQPTSSGIQYAVLDSKKQRELISPCCQSEQLRVHAGLDSFSRAGKIMFQHLNFSHRCSRPLSAAATKKGQWEWRSRRRFTGRGPKDLKTEPVVPKLSGI